MTQPVRRRSFLRGAGVALALPWLEAMLPRAAFAGQEAPRRLAFLFVPNGIHMQDWTPGTTGADFELPWILEPLAPVREDIAVLSGLTHDKARANGDGPGDHARSAAAFLTAAQPRKTAGSDIHVGVSVDQLLASRIGRRTRLPSLELGCEPARQSGQCDSGYSCAYSSNISWKTPHTPMLKEIDPRLVFERMFGLRRGESAKARKERLHTRKSLLDYVRDDARRLQANVGGADRRKLDEYFTALREIELRVQAAEKGAPPAPGATRPAGIPRVYAEHVRLMADLMVLAFRTDSTRISTFMLANEGSNRTYPQVGVRGGHHHLSHHGGDRRKIESIRKINRFHAEQLAYFLRSLKETRDQDGSLLDSTTVVYGSAISDGNRHNHDELPVLIAGGAKDGPRGHVRYRRETPMANLYLSLMDRMGVRAASFGDSTDRLF